MKTTIEVPDGLFREAKQYAARHNVPLRKVVERGLRMAIQQKPARVRPFKLKTVTSKGQGLQVDGGWETIRSMIYEGHGG